VIVTVTLNPAIDKTLMVRSFTPGATNRATIERVQFGGKGINVARTVKYLGGDVIATGFVGAADHRDTRAMLARHAIDADFVPIEGETRVNLKVIDSVTDVETEINEPGFFVHPGAITALAAKLRVMAQKASVVVLSGSLPPGTPADLYAELIALVRAEGAQTMLDAAGAPLAHGLAAAPDLVKPNRAEAEALLAMPLASEESLAAAAERMMAMGARSVVISLGPGGALSASPTEMWRAHVPAIAARSTVGAGDAMMAALAHGLTRALSAADALRLAAAVSCAAAATMERYPLPHEVEPLLSRILIEPCPVAPVGGGPGAC
jgi:1-phosphofructokinase